MCKRLEAFPVLFSVVRWTGRLRSCGRSSRQSLMFAAMSTFMVACSVAVAAPPKEQKSAGAGPSPQAASNTSDFFGGDQKVVWLKSELSPETKSKAVWLRMAPKVREASEQRARALAESVKSVESSIRRIRAATQYDRFIATVSSLESKFQVLTNQSTLHALVASRFEDEVFSEQAVARALEAHAEALNVKLSQIDDAAFVSLQVDSPLDTRKLKRVVLDMSGIKATTARLADSLVERVHGIIGQQITSTATSFTIGAIMESAAREELAYDEYGNHSIAGEIEALLWGFAAGALAEAVTEHVLDAEGKMRQTLSDGVNEIYNRLLSNDPKLATWRNAFSQIKAVHDQAFVDSVISCIGVERSWALARMK